MLKQIQIVINFLLFFQLQL